MANILQTPNPNTVGIASPEFFKHEFDAAIFLKGYTVIFEKALRCPCNSTHPLIDCENCFGTGFFYINSTRTNALITGINENNQYKSWSEEMLGTIAITVRDENKPNLGYFDKITLKNQFSYFSENLTLRLNDTNSFVFTTYKPINVISIYAFKSSNQKLIKIENYSINENNPYCILIDPNELIEIGSNTISVYYKHEPEYHVLDYPHEVRASWKKDRKTGSLVPIELPVQGIARRSHLIAVGRPNFDGTNILINE